VPYQVILGSREQDENTVTVRTRGGEDLGSMTLDNLTKRLKDDIDCLGRINSED
jgi:threonyl-tRNA synthetase